MTAITHAVRPVKRITRATYGHYRRPVVVCIFGDELIFRLKGKRVRYTIPIISAFDFAIRKEAERLRAEKNAKRAAKKATRRR